MVPGQREGAEGPPLSIGDSLKRERARRGTGTARTAGPEDGRMLSAALSIGVLLALLGSGAAGTAPQGCGECQTRPWGRWRRAQGLGQRPSEPPLPLAPDIPPQELTRMLQILERSVAESEAPNPSVLLAFNLAGATGSNARQQLLKEIEEDAVNRAHKGRGGLGGQPCTPPPPLAPELWGRLFSPCRRQLGPSGVGVPALGTPHAPAAFCPHRHVLGPSGPVHPRPPLLLPRPPARRVTRAQRQPEPSPGPENPQGGGQTGYGG